MTKQSYIGLNKTVLLAQDLQLTIFKGYCNFNIIQIQNFYLFLSLNIYTNYNYIFLQRHLFTEI